MEVSIPVLCFKTLLKTLKGWSKKLVFGFYEDKIKIQASNDFITLIFVEIGKDTIHYAKKPSELFGLELDTSVFSNIIEYADRNAHVTLEYKTIENTLSFFIEKHEHPDSTFIVNIPLPTEEPVVYDMKNKNVSNHCEILFDELCRIVSLLMPYQEYINICFHSSGDRESLFFVVKNQDHQNENPFMSIELPANTTIKRKVQLQCKSGKLICQKQLHKKIRNFTYTNPVVYSIDGKHLQKMLKTIENSSFRPTYVNMNFYNDSVSPLELSYNFPGVGVVKCFVALLYDE